MLIYLKISLKSKLKNTKLLKKQSFTTFKKYQFFINLFLFIAKIIYLD